VGNPQPNEMVVTEIDLVAAFQTHFKKDDVPVISGVSIGGDTSSSKNFGRPQRLSRESRFLNDHSFRLEENMKPRHITRFSFLVFILGSPE
jgi:hypothetical protein